ncbi:acyltransferase family protein [Acetobacter conturbans]|nr:acyltransferase [Acetobacter conturbans]
MRIRSLDALRGIAALIVVFHHALICIPGLNEQRTTLLSQGFAADGSLVYLTPLRIFVSGPSMVIMFFVLSGVVLGFTFVGRDHQKYLPFIAKRFIRIWLPFAVAILVSFALAHVLGGMSVPTAASWFNDRIWEGQTSAGSLAHHLLMDGTQTYLDNPMWSLIIEMRISFIFPILVLLTLYNWRVAIGAALFVGLGLSILSSKIHNEFVLSALTTLEYILPFIVGIYIAEKSKPVRQWVEARSGFARGILWIVGVTGICFYPERTDVILGGKNFVLMLLCVASSSLLIILALAEGKTSRFLNSRIPQFLGRISYSLYLLHVIVLAVVCRLLSDVLPFPATVAIAVAVSVFIAWGFNLLVEKPSTAISRFVGKRISATGSQIPSGTSDGFEESRFVAGRAGVHGKI